MPRVSTVSEIKRMDPDDIIKCFVGKVKKSFGFKSGSNDKGEWSFQHFIMKDEDGAEIKVTLKNRDKAAYKTGDTITLTAHRGKNDWTGLYAKDDEYDGKVSRIILATATAEVEDGEGGGGGDDDERKERRRDEDDEPRSKRRDEDDEPRSKRRDEDDERRPKRRDDDEDRDSRREEREEKDPVREAKHGLMKLSNLAGLSLDAATFTLQQFEQRADITVPPEAIFKLATSMFIDLRKQGFGDNLPIKPLWEVEDKEEDTEKEKEKEPDEDEKPAKKKK